MYDVAIIGSGPAGASAAIFTAKAGKKTIVLDADQSVTKRAWIENHYGAPEISGPDLVETGRKQAAKHGAELVASKAVALETAGENLRVQAEDGTVYEAKHVILATGMSVELAEASGVAVKPGTEPRIKSIVDCDAEGKTSVAGVWAAGTVAGVSMHTIITAGDGAKVAINVISELNGARYVDHDVLKVNG
ncbi:pyridine nucleotide-disulfide oxidoreductase [Paenibacillus sp. MY03]|jgi:thioredoxin reductase (NADPH)|uniref:Pyridine nucleotide-disulfide oxidoreductase n=1 Tax=Paenibacillus agaridevorans TaxID=171404 RepID=A0A2R5EQR5_9BACL|nr:MULTISPECIES: FAD-dependent oxidoreductase [Paenibacillus]OUS76793.1 pyridine nucleotide-disulfide oxidoreductase [Paenibacillus sp. MY03]GBG06103.1 pyridine nucleotide-disulfide oxidoreductase [Paenibacillus agaridevorans]